MTEFSRLEQAAARYGLAVVGGFHPQGRDLGTGDAETVVLLGPGGAEMWEVFCQGPEHQDGAPHAMDRWSHRVITALGETFGAEPAFPFGGPPWAPFQKWAAAGEYAVASPVGMQATPKRGLWTSYRGALKFRVKLVLPDWPKDSPCAPCAAPCRSACPVDAFSSGSYDTRKCVAHVQSDAGQACRDGCLVRKSCPAGQQFVLPTAQRQFHMNAFLASNSD